METETEGATVGEEEGGSLFQNGRRETRRERAYFLDESGEIQVEEEERDGKEAEEEEEEFIIEDFGKLHNEKVGRKTRTKSKRKARESSKSRGRSRSRSPLMTALLPPKPPPFFRPSSAAFVRRCFAPETGEMKPYSARASSTKRERARSSSSARDRPVKPKGMGKATKSTKKLERKEKEKDPLRHLIDCEMEKKFPEAVGGLRKALKAGTLSLSDSPFCSALPITSAAAKYSETERKAIEAQRKWAAIDAERQIREQKLRELLDRIQTEGTGSELELPFPSPSGYFMKTGTRGSLLERGDRETERERGEEGEEEAFLRVFASAKRKDGTEVRWVSPPPASLSPASLSSPEGRDTPRQKRVRTLVDHNRRREQQSTPFDSDAWKSGKRTISRPPQLTIDRKSEQNTRETRQSDRANCSDSGRSSRTTSAKQRQRDRHTGTTMRESKEEAQTASGLSSPLLLGNGPREAAKWIADPSVPLSLSPRSRPSSLMAIGEETRIPDEDDGSYGEGAFNFPPHHSFRGTCGLVLSPCSI